MDYENKTSNKTHNESSYARHENKPRVRLWSDPIPSKLEGIKKALFQTSNASGVDINHTEVEINPGLPVEARVMDNKLIIKRQRAITYAIENSSGRGMPDNLTINQNSITSGLNVEIIYVFEYINYWTVGKKQSLDFSQSSYKDKNGMTVEWKMVPAIMDIMDILEGKPAHRCGFNGHGYKRILTVCKSLQTTEK